MGEIGVEGQYKFRFLSESDIIDDADDLKIFKYIESAGNHLPLFEFSLVSQNDDSISDMTENLSFFVDGYSPGSVGGGAFWESTLKSKKLELSVDLLASHTVRTIMGDDKYAHTVTGTYNNRKYYANPFRQITDFIPSTDAMALAVGRSGIGFDSDFASGDVQCWIQANVPDKQFVDHLLSHCTTPGSFPVCTIAAASGGLTFKLRSWANVCAQGPVAVLAPWATDYLEWDLIEDPGLMNQLHSLTRIKPVYNLDDDFIYDVDAVRVPELAHGTTPPHTMADVIGYYSESINPLYWNSWLDNKTGRAFFSQRVLRVTLTEQIFHDIKVFDKIMFHHYEIGSGKTRVSPHLSGPWIVSKVGLALSKETFKTTLYCVKESLNM